MSNDEVIRRSAARPGQAQDERSPPELDPGFVEVDDQGVADRVRYVRRLSEQIRFADGSENPSSTWEPLFDDGAALLQALERPDGKMPAHLGLLGAFLQLGESTRAQINRISERHLAFYYRDVLRFRERPAVPDRVHLVLELKKGARPVRVGPEHVFSAGKDDTGVERRYQPIKETVIGSARVESVRSVHLHDDHVLFAPIADSADGLGKPFKDEPPFWSAFGNDELPEAEIGFAVASSVLRLAAGTRTITTTITLDPAPSLGSKTLATSAFKAFVTTKAGWQACPVKDVSLSGSTFTITCEMKPEDDAIVPYDSRLHSGTYGTNAPVLHVVLDWNDSTVAYADWRVARVDKVDVSVQVEGLRDLVVENDLGTLNAKKAFLPFGPTPRQGARFFVHAPELEGKRVSDTKLATVWTGGIPTTAGPKGGDPSVTMLTFPSNAETSGLAAASSMAVAYAATSVRSSYLEKVMASELKWAVRQGNAQRAKGITSVAVRGAQTTTGLVYELASDPGFDRYVVELIEYATAAGEVTRKPTSRVAPSIETMSLNYRAEASATLTGESPEAYEADEIQFFQIDAFGQMQDHRHIRKLLGRRELAVPLLPQHDGPELLIGLSGVSPGDSVSLLFQVVEGRPDPESQAARLTWSVLGDNYWYSLEPADIALDTTGQVRRSGIVELRIPSAATNTNTVLPAGRIWLRATLDGEVGAVCNLQALVANAIEARFQGVNALHLATALALGSITKAVRAPQELKKVTQPFASFGGRPVEPAANLYCRAAERLRHKNRCITAWDYERLVLENFPEIYRVKCIPHAKAGSWFAPGHVLLVVIPDVRDRHVADPLKPKVDIEVIDRIRTLVQSRGPSQAVVAVANPVYEDVQLSFRVAFRAGHDFNFHRRLLQDEIKAFLSPWAFSGERVSALAFGGHIYRSVVLNFVEERPYVDYVTDFRLYGAATAKIPASDVSEVQASAPDAVLVSDETHTIEEA